MAVFSVCCVVSDVGARVSCSGKMPEMLGVAVTTAVGRFVVVSSSYFYNHVPCVLGVVVSGIAFVVITESETTVAWIAWRYAAVPAVP